MSDTIPGDVWPDVDVLEREIRNFLDIAKRLRPSPGEIPRLPGVDIHGVSLPMQRVIGGDHILYIDFNKRFDLDVRIQQAAAAGRTGVAERLAENRRRAGILLADVTGHRMTDALIAAMLHQSFLVGAYYELDLFGEITTKLFEQLNARFHASSSIEKYFTMIYGEISDEGRFRFISAGHPPPQVFSREYARFVPIGRDRLVSFPPVGMFPTRDDLDEQRRPSMYGYKNRYLVNQIDLLAVGDILLLYTDGLPEHGEGTFFPGRVEGLLSAIGDLPAAEICERLRREVLDHAPPRDDISFVVIKRTP